MTATRILSASPATSTLPQGNLLDNLPRINQRGEVEADNVHLEFDYILILNHGADDSILDFAVMQIDADFVADFELALWFPGWHSTNKREAATWQPPFLL